MFKVYPELWSSIIVLSEVFAALKDQLLYKKSFKSTASMSNNLNSLLLQAGHDWFNVANGEFDDKINLVAAEYFATYTDD